MSSPQVRQSNETTKRLVTATAGTCPRPTEDFSYFKTSIIVLPLMAMAFASSVSM